MPIVIPRPTPSVVLTEVSGARMPIVFFGTPNFAVPSLRALHAAGWPIALVVTAPDKPTGRKQVLTPSPVKVAAAELGLPVAHETGDVAAEMGIVVAYNRIIPARVLAQFHRGIINVHPSLLPAYRGPSPIQQAILDGCAATGVSIMRIDEQVDHGPVLAQEPWTLPGGFGYAECESELARLGAELLVRTLDGYVSGTIIPQVQDDRAATVTKKFTRDDGKLDWHQSASAITNRVRALATSPGTWTTWEGAVLNIISGYATTGSAPVGRVVRHQGAVAIGCTDGIFVVEEVHPSGGRAMSATDFANGHSAFIGSEVM